MSTAEWSLAVAWVGFMVVIWQLAGIASRLSRLAAILKSLDSEVFHLAQESNPAYGQCDSCGRRAPVRHVFPTNAKDQAAETPETFYCQACWWMSDSVAMGDESRHYKDRQTARDVLAAKVGPG